jgi:Zn-dependent M28 family amino/carboxypeptidase
VVINVDSLRKLRPARPDSIGNGADDDGSGSVAVLEIAEALAKLPAKPKRSILVVFHTGEEAGLLGSKYFMEHPTVPRDSIVAQVNLDMIGRGRAEDTPEGGPDMVMVVGANRISTELGKIVETANTEKGHKLRLDYSWDAPDHPQRIYGRSDHASYARRGIPIVFFFTGLHIDYHKVTDEPQYIDYPHLTKITKYVYDLMLELGTRPTRPAVDKPVAKPGE